MEQLIHQIAFGEYLWQIQGGIPMSQNETAKLIDMFVAPQEIGALMQPAVMTLATQGNSAAARARLVALMQDNAGHATFGATGLDEELEMIREQFRRFADDRVAPNAHEWHLKDELIPMEIIEELAELGVFGLTIPEEYGGLGCRRPRCAWSPRSCRAAISASARSAPAREIAAELILAGGTDAQKEHWLPKHRRRAKCCRPRSSPSRTPARTSASCAPARCTTATTTCVTGNKTWITHAARSDVMTLLARTDPDSTDHRGLSMFLAARSRAAPMTDPFPAAGHERRRDRGARLSRHEGIRDRASTASRCPPPTCSAAWRARASSS